jgi:hypothetical protein
MVEVVLLFGLLSDLAPVGAVMFADSLAGRLVTVEEGSAAYPKVWRCVCSFWLFALRQGGFKE